MSFEYASFARGGGKLGKFEFGRGGFEAALEVIEADRGKEIEGAVGIG